MNPDQVRLSPLTLLLCGIVGAGAGLLTQTYRSSVGFAPFSPPFSLPASLVVLAVILIVLARKLKKSIADQRRNTVNPFHAVRLLAAARAAQFTGSIFAGFGVGLFVTIIARVSQLTADVWLPMILTSIMGVALLVAGIIAEHACRIPPEDSDSAELSEGEEGTAPGSISAYRAHDE